MKPKRNGSGEGKQPAWGVVDETKGKAKGLMLIDLSSRNSSNSYSRIDLENG